jgi:dienelactone hydrolase
MDSRRDFLGKLSAAAFAAAALPHATTGLAADSPGDGPILPLPTEPTGSSLGSLYPLLKSQLERLTFPLSFMGEAFTDYRAWQKQARAKVEELLFYTPPPCDPRPEIVRRRQRDGYVQEDLSFQTTPDIRVPACLLIPKSADRPAPALVALHDHGGFYLWGREKIVATDGEHPVLTEFKKRFYGGRSVAADLARRGYVVLAIDMFYWGERRVLLDDDPVDWRDRPASLTAERIREFNSRAGANEQLAARGLLAAGLTWPGVMLWDDRRSVDYLLTRPEVDPHRVGCVGLSVGGLRSMYLAALDERIRAAVICGWMASFPAQIKAHLRSSIGFTKLIPGLTRWMDYPDVAAMAMPSSLLVINGRKDGLFEPAGVQASFDKLSACYRKAGFSDRFRASWYDTPHEFNIEMQAEAFAWLDRWL